MTPQGAPTMSRLIIASVMLAMAVVAVRPYLPTIGWVIRVTSEVRSADGDVLFVSVMQFDGVALEWPWHGDISRVPDSAGNTYTLRWRYVRPYTQWPTVLPRGIRLISTRERERPR